VATIIRTVRFSRSVFGPQQVGPTYGIDFILSINSQFYKHYVSTDICNRGAAFL
jgi:hypothetical protein